MADCSQLSQRHTRELGTGRQRLWRKGEQGGNKVGTAKPAGNVLARARDQCCFQQINLCMPAHTPSQDLFTLFKNISKIAFPESLAFVSAQLQRVTSASAGHPAATFQVRP